MNRKKQTEKLLREHYERYPELQIKDILKFLYQSSFGCEHLLTDRVAAGDYIVNEAEKCHPHVGKWTEPLDGAFCRVHLDWIKEGISAETLTDFFIRSAKPIENGKERLEEKLSILLGMVKKGQLPFHLEDVELEIKVWREAGYPACHHSDKFREHYFPAYRVIKRRYAGYLPILLLINKISFGKSSKKSKKH